MANRQLAPSACHRRSSWYWETDANDVELHVRDAAAGRAWFSHETLESGVTEWGCFSRAGKTRERAFKHTKILSSVDPTIL